MAESRPPDWKNYEDFADGIATNRLPSTDRLANSELRINLSDGTDMKCEFLDGKTFDWSVVSGPYSGSSGKDWYEAIDVAEDVIFIDTLFKSRPRDAMTVIVNTATRRILAILSTVAENKVEGVPRVSQDFMTGILGDPNIPPTGPEPVPTRDLIGLRVFNTYSPNHVYEHVYLNSQRYCWQNLIGVQRGQGDVDMATYYKFDENQYLFAFREFKIDVASVFFYNYDDMRQTGKFLGLDSNGKVMNNPAGAFVQKASMTFYMKDAQPV
jgi:hypothetical protein